MFHHVPSPGPHCANVPAASCAKPIEISSSTSSFGSAATPLMINSKKLFISLSQTIYSVERYATGTALVFKLILNRLGGGGGVGGFGYGLNSAPTAHASRCTIQYTFTPVRS